jgi:4-aminobutyrate aminotransferase-like enzyme
VTKFKPGRPDDVSTASRDVAERCRRFEGGGLRTFVEDPPFVWDRAEGCRIYDADGRAYLDMYAGFAVAAVGHAHPAVVEAIRRQAGELTHCPSAHPSRRRAEFLEALASIAAPGLDRFLPAVTGAMANEVALALARTAREGGEVIAFSGGYLGRTAGVVGLAGKASYREALGVPPAAHFVPYPYPLRMGKGTTELVIEHLERLTGPAGGVGRLAAVILEPIQGNGGVIIPPPDFLPAIRRFCDRTGALLILDEIQSGFGRTGKMWATEHVGVSPDLMTVGKGIGGGLAAAAVLGRDDLMQWDPDAYTSTFLTNNLNLAAATAAIEVMRSEELDRRAARLGPGSLSRLRELVQNLPRVAEVRGVGLWFGIELVDQDGTPDSALAARVVRRARERGVIVGRGGYEGHVIKLSPPLVIADSELDRGIELTAEALVAAAEEGDIR